MHLQGKIFVFRDFRRVCFFPPRLLEKIRPALEQVWRDVVGLVWVLKESWV